MAHRHQHINEPQFLPLYTTLIHRRPLNVPLPESLQHRGSSLCSLSAQNFPVDLTGNLHASTPHPFTATSSRPSSGVKQCPSLAHKALCSCSPPPLPQLSASSHVHPSSPLFFHTGLLNAPSFWTVLLSTAEQCTSWGGRGEDDTEEREDRELNVRMSGKVTEKHCFISSPKNTHIWFKWSYVTWVIISPSPKEP